MTKDLGVAKVQYLYDTCTLLWFLTGNRDEISETALSIISDKKSGRFVSVVSFWELAIKAISKGQPIPGGSIPVLTSVCQQKDFVILSLTHDDVDELHRLSIPPQCLHKDPFDRMLTAIALAGAYTALTPDEKWDQYGVNRSW